eukprot:2630327-Pyramimonas_sp.AAC.1
MMRLLNPSANFACAARGRVCPSPECASSCDATSYESSPMVRPSPGTNSGARAVPVAGVAGA